MVGEKSAPKTQRRIVLCGSIATLREHVARNNAPSSAILRDYSPFCFVSAWAEVEVPSR